MGGADLTNPALHRLCALCAVTAYYEVAEFISKLSCVPFVNHINTAYENNPSTGLEFFKGA